MDVESSIELMMRSQVLNDRLSLVERAFLDSYGLKGRVWHKHLVGHPSTFSKFIYFIERNIEKKYFWKESIQITNSALPCILGIYRWNNPSLIGFQKFTKISFTNNANIEDQVKEYSGNFSKSRGILIK